MDDAVRHDPRAAGGRLTHAEHEILASSPVVGSTQAPRSRRSRAGDMFLDPLLPLLTTCQKTGSDLADPC